MKSMNVLEPRPSKKFPKGSVCPFTSAQDNLRTPPKHYGERKREQTLHGSYAKGPVGKGFSAGRGRGLPLAPRNFEQKPFGRGTTGGFGFGREDVRPHKRNDYRRNYEYSSPSSSPLSGEDRRCKEAAAILMGSLSDDETPKLLTEDESDDETEDESDDETDDETEEPPVFADCEEPLVEEPAWHLQMEDCAVAELVHNMFPSEASCLIAGYCGLPTTPQSTGLAMRRAMESARKAYKEKQSKAGKKAIADFEAWVLGTKPEPGKPAQPGFFKLNYYSGYSMDSYTNHDGMRDRMRAMFRGPTSRFVKSLLDGTNKLLRWKPESARNNKRSGEEYMSRDQTMIADAVGLLKRLRLACWADRKKHNKGVLARISWRAILEKSLHRGFAQVKRIEHVWLGYFEHVNWPVPVPVPEGLKRCERRKLEKHNEPTVTWERIMPLKCWLMVLEFADLRQNYNALVNRRVHLPFLDVLADLPPVAVLEMWRWTRFDAPPCGTMCYRTGTRKATPVKCFWNLTDAERKAGIVGGQSVFTQLEDKGKPVPANRRVEFMRLLEEDQSRVLTPDGCLTKWILSDDAGVFTEEQRQILYRIHGKEIKCSWVVSQMRKEHEAEKDAYAQLLRESPDARALRDKYDEKCQIKNAASIQHAIAKNKTGEFEWDKRADTCRDNHGSNTFHAKFVSVIIFDAVDAAAPPSEEFPDHCLSTPQIAMLIYDYAAPSTGHFPGSDHDEKKCLSNQQALLALRHHVAETAISLHGAKRVSVNPRPQTTFDRFRDFINIYVKTPLYELWTRAQVKAGALKSFKEIWTMNMCDLKFSDPRWKREKVAMLVAMRGDFDKEHMVKVFAKYDIYSVSHMWKMIQAYIKGCKDGHKNYKAIKRNLNIRFLKEMFKFAARFYTKTYGELCTGKFENIASHLDLYTEERMFQFLDAGGVYHGPPGDWRIVALVRKMLWGYKLNGGDISRSERTRLAEPIHPSIVEHMFEWTEKHTCLSTAQQYCGNLSRKRCADCELVKPCPKGTGCDVCAPFKPGTLTILGSDGKRRDRQNNLVRALLYLINTVGRYRNAKTAARRRASNSANRFTSQLWEKMNITVKNVPCWDDMMQVITSLGYDEETVKACYDRWCPAFKRYLGWSCAELLSLDPRSCKDLLELRHCLPRFAQLHCYGALRLMFDTPDRTHGKESRCGDLGCSCNPVYGPLRRACVKLNKTDFNRVFWSSFGRDLWELAVKAGIQHGPIANILQTIPLEIGAPQCEVDPVAEAFKAAKRQVSRGPRPDEQWSSLIHPRFRVSWPRGVTGAVMDGFGRGNFHDGEDHDPVLGAGNGMPECRYAYSHLTQGVKDCLQHHCNDKNPENRAKFEISRLVSKRLNDAGRADKAAGAPKHKTRINLHFRRGDHGLSSGAVCELLSEVAEFVRCRIPLLQIFNFDGDIPFPSTVLVKLAETWRSDATLTLERHRAALRTADTKSSQQHHREEKKKLDCIKKKWEIVNASLDQGQGSKHANYLRVHDPSGKHNPRSKPGKLVPPPKFGGGRNARKGEKQGRKDRKQRQMEKNYGSGPSRHRPSGDEL